MKQRSSYAYDDVITSVVLADDGIIHKLADIPGYC